MGIEGMAFGGRHPRASRRHNGDVDPELSEGPAGSVDDFTRYVEPEIPVLLRVARTLTSSGADAEDLVQETLIRAYRFMDRFDGAHPRAWLLTILRNTASNMRRKSLPDLVDDWDVSGDPRPAFGAQHEEDPEELVMRGVVDGNLRDALSDLNEKYRSVVILVDVHGLTYAECAQSLGIPTGTVMSRLSRGRARLRKALKPSRRIQ